MLAPRPPRPPRRTAIGVSLALASCLLAGCSLSPSTVSRTMSDRLVSSLSFQYMANTGGDYIDQVVQINNDGAEALIPTLKFVAFTQDGVPLPDVQVHTAFGSDKGNVVVPPEGAWDILEFTGEGSQWVTGVDVTVVKTQRTSFPYVENEPETEALDGTGHEDDYFEDFRSVRVSNDNGDPVQVRLAYVVWESDDKPGQQQFQVSVPIGGLVTVPAHGDTLVDVDPAARTAIARYGGDFPANVLAFYSH